MKAALWISICLFLTSSATAQTDWRAMIGDPSYNFFEIQASFYSEFGDRIGEKGSGWKQFKRWEYYYESRVDEIGNFPQPGSVLIEMNRYFTEHPLFENNRGVDNWTELGPISKPANGTGQPNGNGRLTAIAFHPTDPNTLYVGAPAGGFWKSTDNGASWAKSVTGLTRLGVSSIVVHPLNPDIIFIGTGDRDAGDAPGYGVWKSIDGGATWAASNTGMGNRTVYEILMDPTDSDILIAATNSRIYRSTDGGLNWTAQYTGGENFKDIAFKPGDSNTMYAASNDYYMSTDNGVSWSQVTSGVPASTQRMALAVSADEPTWVYLLAGNSSGLVGVYRSTDSGLNFSTRTTTPNIFGWGTTGGTGGQAWYDIVLSADPTDADQLFMGGINIWKSIDGGTNWTLSGHWTGSGGADDVHADQHVMEHSPHSNDIYNGNDGGIYYSSDDGVVWTELSSGLGIAQVYKIGVAQTEENTVINGYQDNGTAIYYDGSWSTEIGGDGMECIIDPTDSDYMYGALYYGDIRRSVNGGLSFSSIVGGISESGAWVTPYKLDPNDANTMLGGFINVWRTNDVKTGPTWTQISSLTGTSTIRDIAIAPSNSDVVYITRSGTSNFYRSTDATAVSPSWTDLDSNLPASGTPSDIEIDHTDATHVFIGLGNNIYESTDSGNSWTDISGTLPSISLNTIVRDTSSTVEAMYIGMDVGVYYIDNILVNWVIYDTNLPNVEITELEIYQNPTECKSKLMACTYGVGLWMNDLKDPGNIAPVACFEASDTELCVGQSAIFTNNSDYSPTSWTWLVSPGTHSYINATTSNSENPEIQFNASGIYNVQLTSTNAFGNDMELKSSYIDVSASSNAPLFDDDLEARSACGITTDCGTTICDLGVASQWTNFTNGVDDDIDWRVDAGGTVSSNTGPSTDYNPGTATGNYLYLEASGGCTSQTAILEGNCIFLDQNYNFELAYHMYGGDMGSLHFDLYTSGAWILDFATSISGDQGDVWNTISIDMSAYTNQTVKMRIRGITGSGFESDLAIDDMQFVTFIILPIELIDFQVNLTEARRVKIEWTTASEINTSHFEIERSENGNLWERILTKPAAGESQQVIHYELWDDSPLMGESYYRLKSIDLDGQFSISEVRTINIVDSDESVYIFPNPMENVVLINQTGIILKKCRNQ